MTPRTFERGRILGVAALGVSLVLLGACTSGVTGGDKNGSVSGDDTTGSGSGAGSGMDTGTDTGTGSGAGGSSSGGASGSGDTSGTTAGGGSGGIPRDEVTFECDPEASPSVSPLRRLTRLQYENSLGDLFGSVGMAGAVDSAESSFAQLPPDGENESVYIGNDARVTQRHVDAYFGVAESIAGVVTGDAEARAALAGDCANDEPLAEACLSEFVSAFGERVFRRPLSEAEVDRYLELLDSGDPGQEVLRGTVFQLLMSPQFLYHFEVEGTAVADDEGHLALGPWELASRLSFHFWQSMPDDELFEAARDGSLATDAGFEAQVTRLFDDERTDATLTKFWHEWYQLDGFAGFASTPAFAAFSSGVDASDSLYQAMLDEVDALVRHYTFETAGTYRDVLASNLIFTTSSELASLYGIEPWDGVGEPPTFSGTERSGLLTRGAMLVEGNELTNPIKRGAFVLRSLLCDDVHPPSDLPAEALALPEPDPDMSTRQRYEEKTASVSCAGCHSQINPFGFVLESFDALGRFRTEELIYDDTGELQNTVPIDPVVDVELGTAEFTVTNPVELNDQLAQSGLVDDCFARQYFRFTYRRDESTGDSCALAGIRDAVAPGGSLKEALRDVALGPSFRQRVVGEL